MSTAPFSLLRSNTRCAVMVYSQAAASIAGMLRAAQGTKSVMHSPDFIPIEQVFAKLKALLRSAAARTIADLLAAIRQAFMRFSPEECRRYITAAGYGDDAYASN